MNQRKGDESNDGAFSLHEKIAIPHFGGNLAQLLAADGDLAQVQVVRSLVVSVVDDREFDVLGSLRAAAGQWAKHCIAVLHPPSCKFSWRCVAPHALPLE